MIVVGLNKTFGEGDEVVSDENCMFKIYIQRLGCVFSEMPFLMG